MAENKVDLENESVHWDLGTSQSYGEYLQLDKLLTAQRPNSNEQDEMLFIIVHQVSELWMRLFLHELDHVFECVRRDDLDPSFKMLARISRLQEELLGAWSVLSTLTPFEYSSFRNTLGRSSGFQSVQYRLLEFKLGNKNRDIIAVQKRDPAAYERLDIALNAPSIYDEVLRLLSRRGYDIPAAAIERDFSEPYAASKAVTAAWLARAAARRLEPRVAALARGAGVSYARVAIRRQRSRWGSCSARGTISLNLCLLFQRPEVVDYLIIHELMHVQHMNHSPRFWAAVEKHCAGWRALDRELLAGWRTVPRWVFSDHPSH
jgi:tryptophan 2,3-dioxygenase